MSRRGFFAGVIGLLVAPVAKWLSKPKDRPVTINGVLVKWIEPWSDPPFPYCGPVDLDDLYDEPTIYRSRRKPLGIEFWLRG